LIIPEKICFQPIYEWQTQNYMHEGSCHIHTNIIKKIYYIYIKSKYVFVLNNIKRFQHQYNFNNT